LIPVRSALLPLCEDRLIDAAHFIQVMLLEVSQGIPHVKDVLVGSLRFDIGVSAAAVNRITSGILPHNEAKL
jgi:hypothetical protein